MAALPLPPIASSKPTGGTESCLVCGAPTKGMHFQLTTCRACAAFFRRSVKAKKVYRCRRNNQACDLSKAVNGKPLCRFCRLRKCYSIGMRVENGSTDDEPQVSETLDADASPPKEVASSSSSSSPSETKFKIPSIVDSFRLKSDIDRIIEDIKFVLRQSRQTYGYGEGPLVQIQQSYRRLREKTVPPYPLKPCDSYDKVMYYEFLERYAVLSAEFMMSCDAFARLPFQDKYRLFKQAWPLMHQIERIYSAFSLYGFDNDKDMILITDTVVVDVNNSGVYFTHMDPKKFQELMKFCFPLRQEWKENIIDPIRAMRMTEVELCYILGLIMFGAEKINNHLERETKRISEEMTDVMSSALHDYYVDDMDLPNYAGRHAKLLRLLSSAQQHAHSVRDRMLMAKVGKGMTSLFAICMNLNCLTESYLLCL